MVFRLAGRADEPVTADDGDAQVDGGGRYDAVGKIGNIGARHLAHGFDDGDGKDSLCKNVLGVRERLRQIFIRQFWNATLLDQINEFGEADAGNRNLLPCRRGLLDKSSGCNG
jgi:hypothetical protein